MARNRHGTTDIDLGSQTLNEAWRELRADYDTARESRFLRRRLNVAGIGRQADFHYRTEWSYLKMMELARDLDRNDCIIGQGVQRFVSNILQDGFQPDPQTGDRGADTALWECWDAWATDPDQSDAAGEWDFATLAELALHHIVVDGDVFPLPLHAGSIEMVEAHRCRTPSNTTRNVVHGVLFEDQQRKRLEYWFTKDDIGTSAALSRVSDIQAYPARQYDPITGRDERAVLHCYHPKRVSQTRGVTAFAPIAAMVGIHDDLQFAQLVKAQVQACWAILEEVPLGGPPGLPSKTGEQTTDTLDDGTTRTLTGVSSGDACSQPARLEDARIFAERAES